MSAVFEQTVTDTVAAWLSHRHLKQEWVASTLHVSQSSVSARVRGKTPWSLADLDALARGLDIPAWWLVAGVPPTVTADAEAEALAAIADYRDRYAPDDDARCAAAAFEVLARRASTHLRPGAHPVYTPGRAVVLAHAAALARSEWEAQQPTKRVTSGGGAR